MISSLNERYQNNQRIRPPLSQASHLISIILYYNSRILTISRVDCSTLSTVTSVPAIQTIYRMGLCRVELQFGYFFSCQRNRACDQARTGANITHLFLTTLQIETAVNTLGNSVKEETSGHQDPTDTAGTIQCSTVRYGVRL